MCGRKTLTNSKKSIIEELMINEWLINNYRPSYNIAPTHYSPVLIGHRGKRIAKMMRFGLIPTWSKDASFASKMINARSETITEKPSFKNLISKNRCIIISNGYYEWKSKINEKEPYYFHHQKNNLLLFAGLWTSWKKSSKNIKTYAIITTVAHTNITHIHNRMPLIIDPMNVDLWLNENDEKFNLNHYLKNHQNHQFLSHFKVTSFVNLTMNNSKECLKPASNTKTLGLFK